MKELTAQENREFERLIVEAKSGLILIGEKMCGILGREIYFLEICDELKRRAGLELKEYTK